MGLRAGMMAAATLLAVMGASASDAATVRVSVGGNLWDVTTFEGFFYENGSSPPVSGVLLAQPWWGNRDLAVEFSVAVGGSLGGPNLGGENPYFAFVDYAGIFGTALFNPFSAFSDVELGTDDPAVFASATRVPPIPLPAGGILLVTALAAAGLGFRKRKAA